MLQNLEMSAAPLPRPHLLRLRLGLAVWSVRQARSLTQRELAQKMRTSRAWISEVERAECLPNIETLVRLAQALSVRPDVLLRIARL